MNTKSHYIISHISGADVHYGSLFAEGPRSITVDRYGRIVNPVHREGTS